MIKERRKTEDKRNRKNEIRLEKKSFVDEIKAEHIKSLFQFKLLSNSLVVGNIPLLLVFFFQLTS